MNIVGYLGTALTAQQAGVFYHQWQERLDLHGVVHQLARARGKPALIVGRPTQLWSNPCAIDGVTLDLDGRVMRDCPLSGMVADVRAIPVPDGAFGATGSFHVLEHLHSLEDAAAAWVELHRVTDGPVYVAYPRRSGIWNHLHTDHRLWTEPYGDVLAVTERRAPGRQAFIGPDGTIDVVGQVPPSFGGL